MNLKITTALTAVAALSAASASASTVSINFNGNTDSNMGLADVAGASGAAASNWNNFNATSVASTPLGSLIDDSGAATTASVTTTGGLGEWNISTGTATGEDTMWNGLFETDGSVATVTVAGLNFSSYNVYVYFDGDNGTNWRTATYTIGGTSFTGEDSEGTNWGTGQNANKVYQVPVAGDGGNEPFPTSPNNSEGNYFVFNGVTGSSFTLEFNGGAAATGTQRGVVNGIQIVQIPEPSTALLGGLGLLALLRRRR